MSLLHMSRSDVGIVHGKQTPDTALNNFCQYNERNEKSLFVFHVFVFCIVIPYSKVVVFYRYMLSSHQCCGAELFWSALVIFSSSKSTYGSNGL